MSSEVTDEQKRNILRLSLEKKKPVEITLETGLSYSQVKAVLEEGEKGNINMAPNIVLGTEESKSSEEIKPPQPIEPSTAPTAPPKVKHRRPYRRHKPRPHQIKYIGFSLPGHAASAQEIINYHENLERREIELQEAKEEETDRNLLRYIARRSAAKRKKGASWQDMLVYRDRLHLNMGDIASSEERLLDEGYIKIVYSDGEHISVITKKGTTYLESPKRRRKN